jgi:hypothetical protein
MHFCTWKWLGRESPDYLSHHGYCVYLAYHGYLGKPQTTLMLLEPFTEIEGKILVNIIMLCIHFLTYFMLWYQVRHNRIVANSESWKCEKTWLQPILWEIPQFASENSQKPVGVADPISAYLPNECLMPYCCAKPFSSSFYCFFLLFFQAGFCYSVMG